MPDSSGLDGLDGLVQFPEYSCAYYTGWFLVGKEGMRYPFFLPYAYIYIYICIGP